MTTADPKTEAEQVLNAFWWRRSLPVDPVQIAESMGVSVREAAMPENVSGALIKDPGSDAIIMLQSSDGDNRKRFTCAHELGHYVSRAGDESIEYVDLRDDMFSGAGTKPEEVFANQFAACLLMPESNVRDLYRPTEPVWLLAKQFGVSAEAMQWRLKNLGLIKTK